MIGPKQFGKFLNEPKLPVMPGIVQRLKEHSPDEFPKPQLDLGNKPPEIPVHKIKKQTDIPIVRSIVRYINGLRHSRNQNNIKKLCDNMNVARDHLVEAYKNFMTTSDGIDAKNFHKASKQLQKFGDKYISIDRRLRDLYDKMNNSDKKLLKNIKHDPEIDYEATLFTAESVEKITIPIRKQVREMLYLSPPPPLKTKVDQLIYDLNQRDIQFPVLAPQTDLEDDALMYQNLIIAKTVNYLENFKDLIDKSFRENPTDFQAIVRGFTDVADLFVDENIQRRDEMIDYITSQALRVFHEEYKKYIPEVSAKSDTG